MSFHSTALKKAARRSIKPAVNNICEKSFRWLIVLRFAANFVLFIPRLCIYFVQLIIWLPSQLFTCCGRNGIKHFSFASRWIRELFLSWSIYVARRGGRTDPTNPTTIDSRTTRWQIFWWLYAVFTENLGYFVQDYRAAWKLQPEFDKEFVLYIDNGSRLEIPCPRFMEDKDFLLRIRVFYNLLRAQGSVFEFFGAKSSLRIDVVALEQFYAVGTRVGPPLPLGRYGPSNRLIRYLNYPSEIDGSSIFQRLKDNGVITVPRRQSCALNIIRSWDSYITGTIVIIPVILSFLISIIWTVVASVCYRADVNASAQTGFTIGSYVVTAGALLIALVAFLESKYVANDGVLSLSPNSDQLLQPPPQEQLPQQPPSQ